RLVSPCTWMPPDVVALPTTTTDDATLPSSAFVRLRAVVSSMPPSVIGRVRLVGTNVVRPVPELIAPPTLMLSPTILISPPKLDTEPESRSTAVAGPCPVIVTVPDAVEEDALEFRIWTPCAEALEPKMDTAPPLTWELVPNKLSDR